VDDAKEKGARVLVGGSPGDDQFYQPTVLVDVTPAMRIWSEEVFGPVLTVIKVENDSEVPSTPLSPLFLNQLTPFQ
jgi:acyl-CoA reductase-like NAD-dependent aldehyde dehydrogenase